MPLRPVEALAPLGAEPTFAKKCDRGGMTTGEAFPVLGPSHLTAFLSFTLALSALAAVPAHAQMLDGSMTTASDFGARKIFLMLFLMIGPIKILVPFVEITRGADRAFRRTLARRAILFSAAALALAGVLGRSMLENFEISLPVLALTGGVVLFLVALRTVLQQSAGIPASAKSGRSAARPEISLRAARVPDDRHALRDRRGDCLCNPCCGPGGRGVHGGRHRAAHTGSRLGGDAVCRNDPPDESAPCFRCLPSCSASPRSLSACR